MRPVSAGAPYNLAAELLAAGADGSVAFRLRGDASRRDVLRSDLRRRIRQTAAAFRRLGLEPEQRTVLVLPDSPELVEAFLGTLWAGGVAALVNPFLRTEEVLAAVEEARARVVVTLPVHAGAIERAGIPWRPAVLVAEPATPGSFRTAVDGESADFEAFPSHPDDPAFWLYSSGTTGRPKAVVHLHRNVYGTVSGYARSILGIGPEDVVLCTSKMFFAYGFGASLSFPLATGASAVLSPERFHPERTWRLLAEERPSVLFAVPSAYAALLREAPVTAAAALSSVRLCVSAGETLPEPVFREWHARFGLEILDGLGSTEALHIFLSNRPGEARSGSLGKPVPGYELKAVDEDGSAVPPGTPGALLVRGASLAAGYWQRSEATRHTFRGEWLATGDQAVEERDGTWRVLGRTDDLLKIEGRWVSPAEVEAALAAVPGIAECAVVGCPGERGLLEVVACVVAAPEHREAVRRAAMQTAEERLARFQRPHRIVFLDALPRTATGKIQRSALRDLVSRGAAA